MSAAQKSLARGGHGTAFWRGWTCFPSANCGRLSTAFCVWRKSTGAEETEVHVDEVEDSLTRFANNAIHQNVAERGLTVSVRTVVDGRTARATTNRMDEDSLRGAIEASLSLAHSQPKDPRLLPDAGEAAISQSGTVRATYCCADA